MRWQRHRRARRHNGAAVTWRQAGSGASVRTGLTNRTGQCRGRSLRALWPCWPTKTGRWAARAVSPELPSPWPINAPACVTVPRHYLRGGDPHPAPVALVLLSACQPGASGGSSPLPGGSSHDAWAGIGEAEALHFIGTEPFWGGEAKAGSRADLGDAREPGGRDGHGDAFRGSQRAWPVGHAWRRAVRPGGERSPPAAMACRTRSYPFTVTVQAHGRTLRGCGWSSKRFTGPENP